MDFTIVSVVGIAASWLLHWGRRRAERLEQEQSIVPRSSDPSPTVPSRFYPVPAKQWSNLSPEIVAVLWVLWDIPAEAMPDIAAKLLENGCDGKWLRRCAGLIRPVRADVEEFADAMFSELGISMLDETEARDRLAKYLVAEVIAERIDPLDAAGRIAYVYDWDMKANPLMSPIIELAYEDEYESLEREAELRRLVFSACEAAAQVYDPLLGFDGHAPSIPSPLVQEQSVSNATEDGS